MIEFSAGELNNNSDLPLFTAENVSIRDTPVPPIVIQLDIPASSTGLLASKGARIIYTDPDNLIGYSTD